MTKPSQVTANDIKVEESGNDYPDGTAHNYVDVKSAVITSPVTATTTATTTDTVYGDANEDGNVSISDAVLIMQSISNSSEYKLSEQGAKNADVIDNDGVTNADALAIQIVEAKVITADKLPMTLKDLETLGIA